MEAEVIGYVHVMFEHMEINESKDDIHCQISLGEIAKVNTSKKPSGSTWNEVYMIEVPKDPARLALLCYKGEQKIAECRYDVNPFFQHPGMAHSVESQLHNDQNDVKGKVRIKITFYSAEHGKLKIRIFHLSLVPPFIEKFKEAKVKVRLGVHAQSTPLFKLQKDLDEAVELILLVPTADLSFDVVHEEGLLATYTINNVEKSGVLQDETKAYQVSLFNNDKAVGDIKYQITWIKKKK